MERRKIIIPTGAQPDEPLPPPHFDAEATLTARRVVPLSEQGASWRQHDGYAQRAAKPFWKRPALLALIVLVAVGIGVAAYFAISLYRNRQTAQTPAASAPPATVENAKAGQQKVEQPAQTPTPQARVVVPEKPAETPAEQKGDDDQEVVPPVVRNDKHDQKNDDDDAQAPDEKQAERERRREERREARRRQREEDDPLDVPRRINRAGRQINDRIREIFEGRQP